MTTNASSINWKRALDIAAATAAVVVLSPVFVVTAAAIFAEDRKGPIFRQQRVGADGEKFTVFKFRSMPVGTASLESREASQLRVTRVGKFIRRTSIDELPQLFNVLRGDMSVVGPRPALPDQGNLITLREQSGAASLRPGLTGLAQVSSYDDMPEDEKAAFDASYSAKVTPLRDLGIIGRTVLYLLKPPPSY